MSNWNEPGPSREPADLRALPRANRPVDCTDEEYEAALWRATDASLRRDPSRWVIKSAADVSFSTASRGNDDDPAVRRGRPGAAASVTSRRARDTWDHLIDDRGRPDHNYDARAAGLKSWETRRCRAQAQARTQSELP